jgi:hypothetical protein
MGNEDFGDFGRDGQTPTTMFGLGGADPAKYQEPADGPTVAVEPFVRVCACAGIKPAEGRQGDERSGVGTPQPVRASGSCKAPQVNA